MSRRKRTKSKESEGLSKVEKRRIANIAGMTVMVVLLGLALYAVAFRGAQRPSAARTKALERAAAVEGRSQTECPTRAGEPWEYDATTQCHFDPGHGHWHLGSPPPASQRGQSAPAAPAVPAAAPASTPEPEQVLPPGAEQE